MTDDDAVMQDLLDTEAELKRLVDHKRALLVALCAAKGTSQHPRLDMAACPWRLRPENNPPQLSVWRGEGAVSVFRRNPKGEIIDVGHWAFLKMCNQDVIVLDRRLEKKE